MAIETIFKYSEAAAWKDAVTTLNEETDDILTAVAKCIQSIGEGCTGSVVEALIDAGGLMLQKFKLLITAIMDLVSALADVINKLKDLEEGIVESLKTAGETILGGLGLG